MRINRTRAIRVALTATLISAILFAGVGVADSPSNVVSNITDTLTTELADIGTALLSLYGLVQIIRVGVSEDTSGAMRKLGISLGLAALLQSWTAIDDWFTGDEGGGLAPNTIMSPIDSVGDMGGYAVDAPIQMVGYAVDVSLQVATVLPV
jgi:hypothetical protein